MDSSFNGFPPIGGRGRTERTQQTDLRSPYSLPSNSIPGGEPSSSPRPNNTTMPSSFAAVVAGHASHHAASGLSGDSTHNTPQQNHNRTNEIHESVNGPRVLQSQAPPPRLSAFTLSPLAKEFVPSSFPQPTPCLEETDSDSQVDFVVGLLGDFIYDVTLNPGKFERNVSNIVQSLIEWVNDEQCLRAIVNTIFDQAIQEPNFRYNAARLCSQLCTSCSYKRLSFHDVLLEKCSSIFENRESEINSEPAKLRGFTFFLGELYTQIKLNERRIEKLAITLPTLFETLLMHGNTENYKCICQMMKFTGPDLEDDEKLRSQSTPIMDKLVSNLEKTIPSAARDIQGMMNSVVQLRGCNWGRATSPTSSNSEQVLTEDIPTEAVFYGPDGQPLSAEESLFLENSTQDAYNSTQYDGDYGDDEDSEGMDDEIAAAYDEFLAFSGQQQ